jgi:hypothetical protein
MEMKKKSGSSIEYLPNQPRPKIVSDELNRILSSLRVACPENAEISFDFDGKLHVHIDIRNLEDVTLTEAILPTLCMGIFHDIGRGNAPHRSFFHRVSAQVEI